jgi:hypothetical protein
MLLFYIFIHIAVAVLHFHPHWCCCYTFSSTLMLLFYISICTPPGINSFSNSSLHIIILSHCPAPPWLYIFYYHHYCSTNIFVFRPATVGLKKLGLKQLTESLWQSIFDQKYYNNHNHNHNPSIPLYVTHQQHIKYRITSLQSCLLHYMTVVYFIVTFLILP